MAKMGIRLPFFNICPGPRPISVTPPRGFTAINQEHLLSETKKAIKAS